jgi:V/A-type H+-transporting ATPase subunit B
MTARPALEYSSVSDVRGPLIVVRGTDGVGWDEFVTVRLGSGEIRHGVVLEVDVDLAVVQVLEGTDGVEPSATGLTFAGSPLRIPVGRAWLGRVCNGRGERWMADHPCWVSGRRR